MRDISTRNELVFEYRQGETQTEISHVRSRGIGVTGDWSWTSTSRTITNGTSLLANAVLRSDLVEPDPTKNRSTFG
jgi:hypothetical protein